MTIDEAIKFCYEKAWDIKLKTEPQTFLDIAEWLEELKEIKEKEEKFDRNIKFFEKLQWESCKAGYRKAIDDICDKAIEWNNQSTKKVPYEFIRWIEKQLKEGAVDG